jgi:hypothetical protein
VLEDDVDEELLEVEELVLLEELEVEELDDELVLLLELPEELLEELYPKELLKELVDEVLERLEFDDVELDVELSIKSKTCINFRVPCISTKANPATRNCPSTTSLPTKLDEQLT